MNCNSNNSLQILNNKKLLCLDLYHLYYLISNNKKIIINDNEINIDKKMENEIIKLYEEKIKNLKYIYLSHKDYIEETNSCKTIDAYVTFALNLSYMKINKNKLSIIHKNKANVQKNLLIDLIDKCKNSPKFDFSFHVYRALDKSNIIDNTIYHPSIMSTSLSMYFSLKWLQNQQCCIYKIKINRNHPFLMIGKFNYEFYKQTKEILFKEACKTLTGREQFELLLPPGKLIKHNEYLLKSIPEEYIEESKNTYLYPTIKENKYFYFMETNFPIKVIECEYVPFYNYDVIETEVGYDFIFKE